jgi:putative nucleotidyltransferase with HDIG domain
MKIPTKEECLVILKNNKVLPKIITHTIAVCDFSMKVCDALEKKGINVNRDLVAAAALLHDIKKLNPGDHEIEGAKLIGSLGYPEVAVLIKKHGLKHSFEDEFYPKTWEEKIIFYSDKRVKNDKVVSIGERFEYIKQTYKRDVVDREIELTKKIEKELLGSEKL